VFWWFERKGQFLRYEAREGANGGYEFCVIDPDGTEHVERFADSAELTKRQEAADYIGGMDGAARLERLTHRRSSWTMSDALIITNTYCSKPDKTLHIFERRDIESRRPRGDP